MMTYKEWLTQATKALNEANPTENGKTDALVLLQFATGKSRTQILAFDETPLEEKARSDLTALLARRLKGEPIAYIVGEKEFWSLSLKVSPDTLIPRPDTEILVEKALELVLAKFDLLSPPQPSAAPPVNGGSEDKIEESLLSLVNEWREDKREESLPSPVCGGRCPKDGRGGELEFRILDLGTGTGAIALALASELFPVTQKKQIQLEIVGVDLMPNAVTLAQSNAEKNQLNVQFLQSHWFENVQGRFDLIVSNPPYIDEQDEHLNQGDVRFEPHSALVAEEQGYGDLRHIIQQAPHYLKAGGYLLLEHGWQQGEKVRSIFLQNHWQEIATVKDYGGNERVTYAFFAEE